MKTMAHDVLLQMAYSSDVMKTSFLIKEGTRTIRYLGSPILN